MFMKKEIPFDVRWWSCEIYYDLSHKVDVFLLGDQWFSVVCNENFSVAENRSSVWNADKK